MPITRAVAVGQRAAGVPGLSAASVCIEVLDQAPAIGERAPERGDDADRDRAREAVGVADRDDELADTQGRGVAEHAGTKPRGVAAHDGEVAERVAADEPEGMLPAVGEAGACPSARARHDVGVRHEQAILAQDDGAAAPTRIRPPPRSA